MMTLDLNSKSFSEADTATQYLIFGFIRQNESDIDKIVDEEINFECILYLVVFVSVQIKNLKAPQGYFGEGDIMHMTLKIDKINNTSNLSYSVNDKAAALRDEQKVSFDGGIKYHMAMYFPVGVKFRLVQFHCIY